jgi:hypothetical protein
VRHRAPLTQRLLGLGFDLARRKQWLLFLLGGSVVLECLDVIGVIQRMSDDGCRVGREWDQAGGIARQVMLCSTAMPGSPSR